MHNNERPGKSLFVVWDLGFVAIVFEPYCSFLHLFKAVMCSEMKEYHGVIRFFVACLLNSMIR